MYCCTWRVPSESTKPANEGSPCTVSTSRWDAWERILQGQAVAEQCGVRNGGLQAGQHHADRQIQFGRIVDEGHEMDGLGAARDARARCRSDERAATPISDQHLALCEDVHGAVGRHAAYVEQSAGGFGRDVCVADVKPASLDVLFQGGAPSGGLATCLQR